MKIAIIGARDGGYLVEEINRKATDIYNVLALADNNNKLWNKDVNGYRVRSVDDVISLYDKGEIERIIIAVRKGYSRFCIIGQLHDKGVKRISCVRPSPLTYRQPITFRADAEKHTRHWVDIDRLEKPLMHHLEINYADGCNLNCRGCLHFSNLFERDEFPDDDELLETIAKVASECEIFQFRILGGEPLLNPGLESFIVRLREILPHADMAVISNGILIPKMPESLFNAMRENDVGFNLTLYPPTLKMKDSIYKTLDKYRVSYGSHEAKTDRFEKFLMCEPSMADTRPYDVCEPRGILVIRGKSIFRCPVEAYIERFYEKFGIDRDIPEGIDVFRFKGDWKNLIESLYTKPHRLCSYCSSKSEFYDWSNGKPEMEDWVVRG